MRIYLYSIIILLLTACASTKQGSTLESIHLYSLGKPLTTKTPVAISVPKDIRFDTTLYVQSGHKTASAFKSEFEKHADSVSLITGCQPNCLEDAKNSGSKYYIDLELMHWEERATNWSGKPDRLTIKVSVYDAPSDLLLTTSYLHTNTTIYAPSGGKVEDFLPDLANQYVLSLY